jgi:hypothetical protein
MINNNNNMSVLSKEARIKMLTESDDEEWERNRQEWIKIQKIKRLNQFHTDACRAYMNGTLPQEHIDMCNKTPGWTWNIKDKM